MQAKKQKTTAAAEAAPQLPGFTQHRGSGLAMDLQQTLANSRVFVVGAGGIGCELLKDLVLCNFKNISTIDMDTIDVSNLNRQFLFTKDDVGKPKAECAARTAMRFNPDCKVTHYVESVIQDKFGPAWVRDNFDLVFNALDNLEARRHMNRVCLAAKVPLIDGGTSGYLGQVQVIKGGVSECYECQAKSPPKSPPVCSIRRTPEAPHHCVHWAKALFGLLFGPKDEGGEGGNVLADMDVDTSAAGSSSSQRGRAEALFDKIYLSDVQDMLALEDLWTTRPPPVPLPLADALKITAPPAAAGAPSPAIGGGKKGPATAALADQRMWSVAECAQTFIDTVCSLWDIADPLRESGDGGLAFEKDDDAHMNFVAAATNLRCFAFDREQKKLRMQTRFHLKGVAGSIVPVVATTNAMVSGMMALEAVKVVVAEAKLKAAAVAAVAAAGGKEEDEAVVMKRAKEEYACGCRNPYLSFSAAGTGRKRQFIVSPALDEPVPTCYICQDNMVEVSLSPDFAATVTVGDLMQAVVMKAFNLSSPNLVSDNPDVTWFWEDVADSEKLKASTLADRGVKVGTVFEVTDDAIEGDFCIKMMLVEAEAAMGEDGGLEEGQVFRLNRAVPTTAVAAAPSDGADDLVAMESAPAADDDDCVMIEDDDEPLEAIE